MTTGWMDTSYDASPFHCPRWTLPGSGFLAVVRCSMHMHGKPHAKRCPLPAKCLGHEHQRSCCCVQALEWKPQKPGNEHAYADAAVFRKFVAVVKVSFNTCAGSRSFESHCCRARMVFSKLPANTVCIHLRVLCDTSRASNYCLCSKLNGM